MLVTILNEENFCAFIMRLFTVEKLEATEIARAETNALNSSLNQVQQNVHQAR